jgi:integrase
MAWHEKHSGSYRGVYRTLDNRKRSKGGFAYPGAALAWAEAAEAAELAGPQPEVVDHGGKAFADYAREWVDRQSGLAPASVTKYRSAVAGIADRAPFADVPVAMVTADRVQRWFAAMDDTESGVGTPTRNYRMKLLRMIFKQARIIDRVRGADGVIIDDPTATLRAAKQRTGRRQRLFLTETEVAAMHAAALTVEGTGTAYLLGLIGVEAGLRWGEIAALSIDDIHLDDTDDPYLWVWRSVVRSTGRIQETTKNGEPRAVPIGSRILADALRARISDVLLLNGPGSLLLPRSLTDPRPLAYSTTEGWFAAIVTASKITREPIGWHDLRHTLGSRLNAQRVDVAIIAEVLGHSQLEVTRRYIHAAEGSVRHAEVVRALSMRGRRA